MTEALLVNRFQTAKLLNVSLRTIDTLISTNALPLTRIGGRVLVRRCELENFIRKDHPTPPKRQRKRVNAELISAS